MAGEGCMDLFVLVEAFNQARETAGVRGPFLGRFAGLSLFGVIVFQCRLLGRVGRWSRQLEGRGREAAFRRLAGCARGSVRIRAEQGLPQRRFGQGIEQKSEDLRGWQPRTTNNPQGHIGEPHHSADRLLLGYDGGFRLPWEYPGGRLGRQWAARERRPLRRGLWCACLLLLSVPSLDFPVVCLRFSHSFPECAPCCVHVSPRQLQILPRICTPMGGFPSML